MQDDIRSLSHSKWRCQYHIVFAPKYRRQEIYGKIKSDIGTVLRKLCEQKGVEIIEAQACPDHIHMMVSIPPSLSVAQFVGYLKGKSSLMIFDRHANLKYKYGNDYVYYVHYENGDIEQYANGNLPKAVRRFMACDRSDYYFMKNKRGEYYHSFMPKMIAE